MVKVEYFHGQDNEAACGVAICRTILHSLYNIVYTEQELVDKAEGLYIEGDIDRKNKRYRILDYTDIKGRNRSGTGLIPLHWKNIAEYHGLKIFTSSNGTIEKLETILRNDMLPIIHRPIPDEDNKERLDGHYLLPYDINGSLQVFDPYKGGKQLVESRDEFYQKWIFPRFDDERWFMFMHHPSFKVPFKGKHM